MADHSAQRWLSLFLLLSSLVLGLFHLANGSVTGGSGFGSGGVQLSGPILLYGEDAGDVVVPPGRTSGGPIDLSPGFSYFGQNMTSLFISRNGYIYFLTNCNSCSFPSGFPFLSPPLIAVLWQDVTTDNMTWAYRLTTDHDTLMVISQCINTELFDQFAPSYVVVVTWFVVPSGNPQSNIFQAILATDGQRSYVLFAYGDLQQSSGGAQVGFNFGDGLNSVTLAGVYTGSSIGIERRSNLRRVDFAGRYLYRVDDLRRIPVLYNGMLRPSEMAYGTLDFGADGRPQFRVTALVELCMDVACGGICDRGFGADEADYVCLALSSFLETTTTTTLSGSLPLFNFYPNYTGPIVLQDLNCSNYQSNGCASTSEVDMFCRNTTKAVGVGCLFTVDDVTPPTGPPTNMCFVDGELRRSDIRIEGSSLNSVQVISFVLEMCVNGSFGGICRKGFDNVDATAVCSSFGYGDRGEVAMDHSNSYSGQIVVQDVNCTGDESQPIQCLGSTDIDSYCRNSTSIVRINCYTARPSPAAIVSSPMSGDYSFGSQVSLTCGVSGLPSPNISWFFNGVLRTDFQPVPMVTFIASLENRGEYFCRADNYLGAPADSAPAFISLNDIQQYLVAVNLTSITRRKRLVNQDTLDILKQLIDQAVGDDVGSMGVSIYSASVFRVTGTSAQILYTLRGPQDVEFPPVNALESAIASFPSHLAITSITRFDGCSQETVELYTWPETSINPNLPAELSCVCKNVIDTGGLAFRATRVCGGDFSNGGMWQAPNNSSCTFNVYTQRICDATSDEVLDVISEDLMDSTVKSLDITFNVLDNVLDMAAENVQNIFQVADILDNIASMFNPTLEEESKKVNVSITSKLFDGIGKVGSTLQGFIVDQPITVTKTNFQIRVEQVDLSNPASSEFMVNTGSPSVEFPQEILGLLPGVSTRAPLVLATIEPVVFQAGLSSSISDSETIGTLFSVSITNVEVVDLTSPVKLNFPKPSEEVQAHDCVFWDFTLNDGRGDWSNSGCTLVKDLGNSPGPLICECNHLSVFGIIYRPVVATTMSMTTMSMTTIAVEPSTTFEVSVIIYVGLGISFVALSIIILTYLISRKLRKQAQIIFINFSLISFYIAFILSSLTKHLNSYDTTDQRICGLFSAILQYFMLVYFLWTASEAVIILYMSRNMFKIPKYHFIISAFVCYVCPLVIVAISLGGYQYFLSGTFCRPTNWPFYFGFVIPFVLTMFFNWALYGASLFFLQSSTNKLNKELKLYLWRYIFSVGILSILFTVAWIFGLIGTSDIARNAHVAGQYIFSIFVAFHSIFTVILHTCRSNTARENWRKLWYIITCSHGQYTPKKTHITATPDTELAEEKFKASEDETLLKVDDKVLANTNTSCPGSSEKMMVDEEELKVELECEDAENKDTPL